MKNTNICIVRPTYYDRSAMLQLSLEYQKNATNSQDFETYIFVDPHPKYGIVSDYDKVITDEYSRIDWPRNSGKYSWYDAVKFVFDNTNYDYVLSIEDDVLISKDYLRLCNQLCRDETLIKDDNILYFHIGAWERPKGNPNKIVRSKASSRSILIYRKKFEIIKDWIRQQNHIEDNDNMMIDILKNYHMTTISPDTNRHAHIGIYGWSANHIHGDNRGQSSIFEKPLTHEELYSLLKQNCLSGEKLIELNKNKNPNYFWDFDPNINFTKLIYDLEDFDYEFFLIPKDFDYQFYIKYHPDLQQVGINDEQKAKQHYLLFGKNENRPYKEIKIDQSTKKHKLELLNNDQWLDSVYSFLIPKDFDYQFYIEYHPDLQQAGINDEQKAKQHYLLFGKNENRPYKEIKIDDILNTQKPKPEFWSDSKNVLYFSPNAPDYDRSSGGNRLLEILKILKDNLKYNIYFFCNGTSDPKYLDVLKNLDIFTYVYNVNNILEKLKQQNINFDYAIFSWYDIASQYVGIVKKYYPECKIIVDSVDVHWLRESRGAASQKIKTSDKILGYKKQLEAKSYIEADVVFAVTDDDKKEIQKEIGYNNNIKILSNIHKKQNITLGENIFFIGNYSHGPNVDAALRAIEIYKNFQKTNFYKNLQYKPKLYIAGPNADEDIKLASQNEGVEFLGHIDSLTDLYSKCCLLLAPLNWGAGIKGKICDSGMCGMPILTSNIGNEGINFIHKNNALIAKTDQEFIESMEYFFGLPEKAKMQLGLAAQNYLDKIVSVEAARNVLEHTLKSKHVIISIVAYSQTEKLAKCLESILSKTKYDNYSIVISDNSSDNKIKNYIQSYLNEYKNKIRYIKNKKNLYFIEANNNILNDPIYSDSDVVLLNDDVEILSDYWLNYLYSGAYSAGYIACVGGKAIYPNGLLAEAGAELYNDGSGKNIGRGQDPNEITFNIPKYVGYCSGCLLYMRRDAIEKLGVLDNSLEKMYYEDSEWQYRAHINGLKTLYEPKCVAIHDEGSSSGNDISSGAKKYQEINKKMFLKKFKNINIEQFNTSYQL